MNKLVIAAVMIAGQQTDESQDKEQTCAAYRALLLSLIQVTPFDTSFK